MRRITHSTAVLALTASYSFGYPDHRSLGIWKDVAHSASRETARTGSANSHSSVSFFRTNLISSHAALELDTMYIDCSKFSDERLPTLKGKMKDWFDEACWHAPSLVVMDNLDRMLGAEVEVRVAWFHEEGR